MVRNLQQVDLVGQSYVKELERFISFIEGKTTDSATDFQYQLYTYGKEIKKREDSITRLPNQIRSQLIKNNMFDAGDLDALRPALVNMIDEYVSIIDHIRDDIRIGVSPIAKLLMLYQMSKGSS